MAYADMKPRERSGLFMAIAGFVLIMTREPAAHLAHRTGPGSQAIVSLVFGVFRPLLLLVGVYSLITSRRDRPRR